MSADGPNLTDFLALFPPADWLRAYEYIPAEQMPEPYHQLLVHEHHMTVTVEAHHGCLVDVRVLQRIHEDDTYARKILLTRQSDGQVVQFGLVRIHFQYCSAAVRDEIVAGQTPIGRILINHDVLRRIEPTAFLRILPGPAMVEWFAMKPAQAVYGRLALIHCDNQPAVELMEVVAP